ncbi:hypothetical protein LCGC14_1692180 [marine sediment metagenome]|uniref:Uncharacterized protein n=1 Tax=marine sediment metagenome TaxID=412755 RepID=A0A0F9K105_9ZZZZ
MHWRLEGWVLEQPVAIALENIKKDNWGKVKLLTPQEKGIYEAGADAMLEAIHKYADGRAVELIKSDDGSIEIYIVI